MKTLKELEVVRALPAAPLVVGDAAMNVRFAPFNQWYEINSSVEGRFLERMAPGAFKKTISENGRSVRVLFNHGLDALGQQVLGTITDLREDPDAAVADVALFPDIPGLLRNGLEAGAYGSSHRFQVMQDEWVDKPAKTAHNPRGLPERTVKEVRLKELGPVTFPANSDATAQVAYSSTTPRSLTDSYYDGLRSRGDHGVEALLARAREVLAPELLSLIESTDATDTSPEGAVRDTPTEEAAGATDGPAKGHPTGLLPSERRACLDSFLARS